MSGELIERLRAGPCACIEAAAEITGLRAELSSLRGEGEAEEHYTVAMDRRPKEIGGVKVGPGLYRIHWKSGGSSLASIGMCANGAWWVAPTNWCAPAVAFRIDEDPEGRWSWAGVEALERIDPDSPTPDSDVFGRLVGALEGLVASCTRTPVGGSDGGTYAVTPPESAALRTAIQALASIPTPDDKP